MASDASAATDPRLVCFITGCDDLSVEIDMPLSQAPERLLACLELLVVPRNNEKAADAYLASVPEYRKKELLDVKSSSDAKRKSDIFDACEDHAMRKLARFIKSEKSPIKEFVQEVAGVKYVHSNGDVSYNIAEVDASDYRDDSSEDESGSEEEDKDT